MVDAGSKYKKDIHMPGLWRLTFNGGQKELKAQVGTCHLQKIAYYILSLRDSVKPTCKNMDRFYDKKLQNSAELVKCIDGCGGRA